MRPLRAARRSCQCALAYTAASAHEVARRDRPPPPFSVARRAPTTRSSSGPSLEAMAAHVRSEPSGDASTEERPSPYPARSRMRRALHRHREPCGTPMAHANRWPAPRSCLSWPVRRPASPSRGPPAPASFASRSPDSGALEVAIWSGATYRRVRSQPRQVHRHDGRRHPRVVLCELTAGRTRPPEAPGRPQGSDCRHLRSRTSSAPRG